MDNCSDGYRHYIMADEPSIEKQKYCYGCELYDVRCSIDHEFKEYVNTHICPCGTCLIKGICGVCCDLFSKFSDGYYKARRIAHEKKSNV